MQGLRINVRAYKVQASTARNSRSAPPPPPRNFRGGHEGLNDLLSGPRTSIFQGFPGVRVEDVNGSDL